MDGEEPLRRCRDRCRKGPVAGRQSKRRHHAIEERQRHRGAGSPQESAARNGSMGGRHGCVVSEDASRFQNAFFRMLYEAGVVVVMVNGVCVLERAA